MKKILAISLVLLTMTACKSDGTAATYNLDMFSLISFGLAIASIIFSVFMGWLSWELYKKSSDASDKTQEAVIRIEASVVGIRGDITEIVKRAVSYWVNDNPSEQIPDLQKSDVTEKLEEITKRLTELSSSDPKAKEIEDRIKEVLNSHQQEINKLNSSLLNAKVQNIFPSANTTTAISLFQDGLSNTDTEKTGQLIIKINKPIKIATATGKFLPSFKAPPELKVKLISSPYTDMSQIHVTSGVGQFSDFHVHLKVPGSLLREGEYIVEYDARIFSQ